MATRKQTNDDWKGALLALSAIGNLMQVSDRKSLTELLQLSRAQVNRLLGNEAKLKQHMQRLREEYESLRTKALQLEEINEGLQKRVAALEKDQLARKGHT